MNTKQVQRVASGYQSAIHTPKHPSYTAFVSETLAQFDMLVAQGFRFTASATDGYANSAEMLSDLRDNKHLIYFTGGQTFESEHPLAAHVRAGMTANEVFRCVHDCLGHLPTNTPYETYEGELQAYRNHREWYSVEARQALFSETNGQLCVYFATGDFLPVQKCAIIPVEELQD